MNTARPAHDDETERDQVVSLAGQNWIEIAAVAFHSYRAFGRGIVQLSKTGSPESYIPEAQITDPQRKDALIAYDPLTMVLIKCPVAQGTVFTDIVAQPAPDEASMMHKLGRTGKDSPYYGSNSTNLIRIADVKYYENILQVALDVTERLHTTLTEPFRRDVLQLAIRVIGQSQTLYHLGSPSVSQVPMLGRSELAVDVSSIASIFRTILETYLTMHEVFFEPQNENDFDFFHSRWMLIGLQNIRKYTDSAVYELFAPESVEPLRVATTNRLKNTTQYQAMLLQKNDPDQAIKALLHRNKDPEEWQRIAQSANISVANYQQMYSAFSGYIHADGYTSFKLQQHDVANFDLLVEMLLHLVTGIVSKMICDLAERYEEAEQIANSDITLYERIQAFRTSLSVGGQSI